MVKKSNNDHKKSKAVEKSDNSEEIIELRDLSLKILVYYLLGEVNESEGKPDFKKIFASNEARRYLDNILHGHAIDRRVFFSHVMNIYKHNFLQGHKSMSTIHRVYNFLVDCGCLERGWQMPLYKEGDENMTVYKSIDNFFEINKTFFDSDDKKAWFILGRLYNAIIWESKNYYKSKEATVTAASGEEDAKKQSESYLEKNFFFGRKYDFATFIYFANQCFDLSVKYGALHKPYIRELSASLKDYMAQANVKTSLTPEEAKYIFAWGMQQWFELDKKKKTAEIKEKEENAADEGDL